MSSDPLPWSLSPEFVISDMQPWHLPDDEQADGVQFERKWRALIHKEEEREKRTEVETSFQFMARISSNKR